MKTLKSIALAGALAVACMEWLGCSSAKVTWQYDAIRAQITKHEAQQKAADEFNRTNTNPMMAGYVEWLNVDWRPYHGQIELGYKPDGTVVWRPLPEAP